MAKTTVTDAFFMANVTQTQAMSNSKKASTDGASFSKTMSNINVNDADTVLNVAKTEENAKASSGTDRSDNRTEKTLEKKTDMTQADENKKTTAEATDVRDDEKLPEETVSKANDVKDAIKDAFGVSDDELEEAMAVLGLTIVDLLNPDSLKDLMMDLAQVEDSLELLTNAELYDGMQQVINLANECVLQLADEFEIPTEELTGMLDDKQLFEDAISGAKNDGIQMMTSGALATEGEDSERHIVDVKITADDSVRTVAPNTTGKTETFSNVQSASKSTNDTNENAGMMNQMTTQTVSVNTLGEVVETIERFSSAYSDGREIVSQVTESIKLNISAESTTMEMQLHPASLGTVNMQISSQNGVVTAQLLVQNEAVKSALESQLVQLQETFKEQGQQVEAVSVSVANYDLNRGMNDNPEERERENAFRMGRAARRRLNLDSITEDEMEELSEDEQVNADMMRRQGNSIDFMA